MPANRYPPLIVGMAVSLIMFCLSLPAFAVLPQIYPLNSVHGISRQITLDSKTLLDQARKQAANTPDRYKLPDYRDRCATWGQHDNRALATATEAVLRMRTLYEAAVRLDNEVTLCDENSYQAMTYYIDLKQAYFEARPYFDKLEGTPDVRAAVWRIRDLTRDLARFYYRDGYDPPPSPYVVQGTPKVFVAPDPVNGTWIRQKAGDIARLSSALYLKAHDLYLRGLANKGVAERYHQLDLAAQRFYRTTVGSASQVGFFQKNYADLLRATQDARDVVGNFRLDFQQDFSRIFNLVNQLNFITPELPLGTFSVKEYHDEF